MPESKHRGLEGRGPRGRSLRVAAQTKSPGQRGDGARQFEIHKPLVRGGLAPYRCHPIHGKAVANNPWVESIRLSCCRQGLVFSNTKVGQRQRALAEKFHEAGLLSAEGLKAVSTQP